MKIVEHKDVYFESRCFRIRFGDYRQFTSSDKGISRARLYATVSLSPGQWSGLSGHIQYQCNNDLKYLVRCGENGWLDFEDDDLGEVACYVKTTSHTLSVPNMELGFCEVLDVATTSFATRYVLDTVFGDT